LSRFSPKAPVAACAGAADTDLVIFSDGPKPGADPAPIHAVRELCRNTAGFRSLRLVERENNWGLARSILAGVGEMLETHDSVIVMEDDLIASPHFLRYMNGALQAYAEDDRILSVSAYVPPPWRVPTRRAMDDVWLSPRMFSTGWGAWRNRWKSIDWEIPDYESFAADPDARAAFALGGADLPGTLDAWHRGELDSWAVRFACAHYRQGRFSLLPRRSYIRQIGFDGSGQHCLPNPTRWFENTRRAPADPVFPENIQPDPVMQARLRRFFDRHHALSRLLGVKPRGIPSGNRRKSR
jgi:hypothetical protein